MSKSTKTTKTVKTTKRTQKSKSNIKGIIYGLFAKLGVDKVSLDEATKAARKIKPNTKFNESHLAWYRCKYQSHLTGRKATKQETEVITN